MSSLMGMPGAWGSLLPAVFNTQPCCHIPSLLDCHPTVSSLVLPYTQTKASWSSDATLIMTLLCTKHISNCPHYLGNKAQAPSLVLKSRLLLPVDSLAEAKWVFPPSTVTILYITLSAQAPEKPSLFLSTYSYPTHSVNPSSSLTSSRKPSLTTPISTSGTLLACTVPDTALGIWCRQLRTVGLILIQKFLSFFDFRTVVLVFASLTLALSPHVQVFPVSKAASSGIHWLFRWKVQGAGAVSSFRLHVLSA